MIGDVRGKVAFITGAASGIGLGMAHAFAGAGMKVAMADIDAEGLETAAADLRASGASVLALPLDVTDRPGWASAADRAEADLGPVQLLCNNAGVSALGMKIETIEPSLWDKVVDINLGSVFNGVHTFAARLRAAGGGHVVNTASLAGLSATASGIGAYAATKFAVVGLSEVLRAELAPDGIGVSVLCPGPVRSRLWRTSRHIRGLPDTDVPPPESLLGSASPDGLDPFVLGRRVLDAVQANEFYVITHAEPRAGVVLRHEQIMAAFDRAETGIPTQ
jgi:NAD(P)-dependent dehydrogenase (short-subunit alcohol dehydrogenase family)